MKRVYVSSTYEDLKDHRQATIDVLRGSGYDVEAMEGHSARDDRPKGACEADASNCDLYIGIFAWKYGYVPSEANPDGRSITELEYLAAEQAQKPRLIFLLADDAPWSSKLRDAEQEPDEGKRIRTLRNRLKSERWTAFFKSPDDLAKQVLMSVLQYEATKRVAGMAEAIADINRAIDLGPSFLANIKQRIDQLGSAEFVALRLGPTPWWNTRLHLTTALASDFTEIRQFILLDAQGKFVTMASPAEIRRASTRAAPELEMAYLQARQAASVLPGDESTNIVYGYATALATVFAGMAENSIKRDVTPATLRELGIKPEGEVLERFAVENRALLNSDLLRRKMPYIAIFRNDNLEGVIDRAELASRIASIAL
jgi:hypothetical protein